MRVWDIPFAVPIAGLVTIRAATTIACLVNSLMMQVVPVVIHLIWPVFGGSDPDGGTSIRRPAGCTFNRPSVMEKRHRFRE